VFSEEDNILHDFKARIDDKITLNHSISDFATLFENITKTNRVFIGQKDSLRLFAAIFGQSFKDSFHISKYGGGISPYSLVINPFFERKLEIDINKMLVQFEKEKSNVYYNDFFFNNRIIKFLESGIYDQWLAISERMETNYPNEKHIHQECRRFEVLTLSKTAGIFYLLISGNFASFILLFLETLLFFIFKYLN
jgi:hypothetical protein